MQHRYLTEQEFNLVKLRTLKNIETERSQALYRRTLLNIDEILKKSRYPSDNITPVIKDLSLKDFNSIQNALYESFYLYIMAIGNIEPSLAEGLDSYVNIMAPPEATKEQAKSIEYVDLSRKSIAYREWSPYNDSADNCVINYYTNLNRTIENTLKVEILNSLLHPYMYSSLRSKKQMGYVVNSAVETVRPQLGIRVIVQGSKNTPVEIDREIEATLKEFERVLTTVKDYKHLYGF